MCLTSPSRRGKDSVRPDHLGVLRGRAFWQLLEGSASEAILLKTAGWWRSSSETPGSFDYLRFFAVRSFLVSMHLSVGEEDLMFNAVERRWNWLVGGVAS